MIARVCEQCGIAFQAGQRRARFCSLPCSAASRKRDRPCETCGKQIAGRTGITRFCSNACATEARRVPVETRFWAKVDRTAEGGCWLWRGGTAGNGYGKFRTSGRSLFAHRLAYEFVVGPIPAGLTLDHLCRVTLCVNPEHLEPVTNRENCLRGHAAKRRERRVGGEVLLAHEREPDLGLPT